MFSRVIYKVFSLKLEFSLCRPARQIQQKKLRDSVHALGVFYCGLKPEAVTLSCPLTKDMNVVNGILAYDIFPFSVASSFSHIAQISDNVL